jgi:hypothetical protein
VSTDADDKDESKSSRLRDDVLRKLTELADSRKSDCGTIAYHFTAFGEPGSLAPTSLIGLLRAAGCSVTVDEEMSGDGYWHVAAFRHAALGEQPLMDAMVEMSRLADQTSTRFVGWDFAQTVAGEWVTPSDPG